MKRPHRLLRFLIFFCAAGVVCSALVLLSCRREDAEGEAAYRQIRRSCTAPSSEKTAGSVRSSPEEKNDPKPDTVNFDALKQINPDTAAWISADGTPLNYPVVRGKNNAYYLNHLFTGKRGRMGTLFLDFRCSGDFSDSNTILYGHNMKDGSMFAFLERYKQQSGYDRTPTMRLNTPSGGFTVELFAGTVVDGSRESVPLRFAGCSDFLKYTAALKRESTFHSDVSVAAGDRIVTLCTCTSAFQNARYALFGKLVPDP